MNIRGSVNRLSSFLVNLPFDGLKKKDERWAKQIRLTTWIDVSCNGPENVYCIDVEVFGDLGCRIRFTDAPFAPWFWTRKDHVGTTSTVEHRGVTWFASGLCLLNLSPNSRGRGKQQSKNWNLWKSGALSVNLPRFKQIWLNSPCCLSHCGTCCRTLPHGQINHTETQTKTREAWNRFHQSWDQQDDTSDDRWPWTRFLVVATTTCFISCGHGLVMCSKTWAQRGLNANSSTWTLYTYLLIVRDAPWVPVAVRALKKFVNK